MTSVVDNFCFKMDAVIWKLVKYARSSIESIEADQWQVINGSTGDLSLLITNTRHLIVTFNESVEENYLLFNSRDVIKAVSKGDSMMVIVNIENAFRRFRVQFANSVDKSALEQCIDCASRLARHINVTRWTPDHSTQLPVLPTYQNEAVIEDRVPLSQLARVMSNDSVGCLPVVYQKSSFTSEDLSAILPLCLSDSSFSSFVGHVEQQLNSLAALTS